MRIEPSIYWYCQAIRKWCPWQIPNCSIGQLDIHRNHLVHKFNPISTGLWNNWFLLGGGDFTPPRDSLLAKPRMDQNWCHFIHIKYEQFVGQRKKEHQFWSKNVAVAAKYKNSARDINLLKSAYTAENMWKCENNVKKCEIMWKCENNATSGRELLSRSWDGLSWVGQLRQSVAIFKNCDNETCCLSFTSN